ncbi:MAG: hypothetical protein ABSD88_15510, partial [Candidatus Korobacteraceae bacterium]
LANFHLAETGLRRALRRSCILGWVLRHEEALYSGQGESAGVDAPTTAGLETSATLRRVL